MLSTAESSTLQRRREGSLGSGSLEASGTGFLADEVCKKLMGNGFMDKIMQVARQQALLTVYDMMPDAHSTPKKNVSCTSSGTGQALIWCNNLTLIWRCHRWVRRIDILGGVQV